MYIQNYEELDEKCRGWAEFLGYVGKAILTLEMNNPHRESLIRSFRAGLMELSQKTGRPIEICDVKGEIWINIRERKPISKEAIESLIMNNYIDEVPIPQYYKPVKLVAPTVNMTERIKSQWRW